MRAAGHRATATASWLAVAVATGLPFSQAVTGAAVAGAFSHGKWSPDVDHSGLTAKLIPGGHRGITHRWVVLIPLVFASVGAPADVAWVWRAVLTAWASHIAADRAFTALRWRTGGRAEQVATPLLWTAAGALVIVTALPG